MPDRTPQTEIPSRPQVRKLPITIGEFRKNYEEQGLLSEANKILEVFDTATKEHPTVVIRPTPMFYCLYIGNNGIQVFLNADPQKYHGVYVYQPISYESVLELGDQLELQVKKSDNPNFAEIIVFNGIDGIKQVSAVIDKLVSGLIQIFEQSAS